MLARRSIAFVTLVGALAAGPSLAAGQDVQTIGQGVRAGGVDLSGLTIEQAAARLDKQLAPRLQSPVQVSTAGRSFTLAGAEAGVRFDAARTAQRAYNAGRDAPPPPTDGSSAAPVIVPLVLAHSARAVRAFAERLAQQTSRAPADATLRITLAKMVRRKPRFGLRLNAARLAAKLDAVLDDPTLARTLRPRRGRVHPAVGLRGLAAKYPTVLTVDRDHFKLRLFKRLRLVRTYGIAVGQAGLATPAGLFRIADKQVNPAWHVPRSPWAGSLAGQTIPGGVPSNPLKARWLGIAQGVGIHGTAEDWSIGSRASHGCIRMHVGDVINLYPRVPVGTPVLIR